MALVAFVFFLSYRWGALPQVQVGRPSGASQLDRGVEGPYRPRALWAVGPVGPLFFPFPSRLDTHTRAQLAKHVLPDNTPANIQ